MTNGINGFFINGKEVKQVSLGGKVFYKKHDYELNITSDKQILSAYDNESCTITARLTDQGEPVSGETIIFSSDYIFNIQQVYNIYKKVGDFILSNITNISNYVVFALGGDDNNIYINNNSLLRRINNNVTYIDDVNLTYGIKVEGDILTYLDSSDNEKSIDISTISKEDRILSVKSSSLLGLPQASATTDSNGECSITYSSKGVGNITFKSTSDNITSNTITIEDCGYYDSCATDKTSKYVPCVVEGGSPRAITFDTDKYASVSVSDSSFTAFVTDYVYPTNCIIEADIYKSNDSGFGMGFGVVTATGKASYNGVQVFGTDSSMYCYAYQSWVQGGWSNNNHSSVLNNWFHLKIIKTNYSLAITFELNGSIIYNQTKTLCGGLQGQNLCLSLFCANANGNYIKNIKVKSSNDDIDINANTNINPSKDTVIFNNINSIKLTSNKEELNNNNNTCILTATVKNNDNPVNNVVVKFFRGDESLGKSTTNANGVATKTYSASNKAGNIPFTAKIGNVSSQILNIEHDFHKDVNKISLQSDKKILSQKNNDSCVLTITAFNNEDLVDNTYVNLYKGTNLLDTITTDNNGVATYTYNSQGDGDVEFIAESNGVLSNTLTVEDYLRYDTGSSDKTSSYSYYNTTNKSSLTFNSDKYEYDMTSNVSSVSNLEALLLSQLSVDKDYIVKIDILNYSRSGDYNFFLWGFPTTTVSENNSILVGSTTSGRLGRVRIGSTNYQNFPSGALNTGVWYTFILKIIDGNTELEIWDNNHQRILVYGHEIGFDYTTLYITLALLYNMSVNYFKNVEIKELNIVGVDNGLTLNSNKSILSMYDDDSCTLTATYLDTNSNPVTDTSISFYKNGLLFGTGVTDSNGVAVCNKTYNSTGEGDVLFTCKTGNLESSLLIIEDCLLYSATEQTYTSTNSSAKFVRLLNDFSFTNSDVLLEYDYKLVSGSSVGLCINDANSGSTLTKYVSCVNNGTYIRCYWGTSTSNEDYFSMTSPVTDYYYHVRIIQKNQKYKFQLDNGIQGGYGKDHSYIGNYEKALGIEEWKSGSTIKYKNVKVKDIGDGLTLNTSKTILSYVDDDTLNLSAKLQSETSNISGVTVTFYKNNTVFGTGVTDNNGIAVCNNSYTANGDGNITFYAETESYTSNNITIEDNYAYTTDFSNYTSTTNKGNSFKFSNYALPSNHRIEFKLKTNDGINISCGDSSTLGNSGYLEWIYSWYNDTAKLWTRDSSNSEVSSNLSYSNNNTSIFAIEYNNNKISLYKDTTLIIDKDCYNPLNLTGKIRLTEISTSRIAYIKVNEINNI